MTTVVVSCCQGSVRDTQCSNSVVNVHAHACEAKREHDARGETQGLREQKQHKSEMGGIIFVCVLMGATQIIQIIM